MLSDSEVTLNDHVLKESECRCTRRSSQYVNKLLCELECSAFKLHILAWRPIEDKTKVNVNQMATLVDENITVMTVFDLKNKADDRICSKTPDKVIASRFEL